MLVILLTLFCCLNSIQGKLNLPQFPSATIESIRSPSFWIDWFNKLDKIRNLTTDAFNCATLGYFPHPTLCNRYFRCVDGQNNSNYLSSFQKYEFLCAPGTFFDTRISQCTHALNATTIARCEYEADSQVEPVDPNNDSFYTAGYETEEYCIYDLRLHYLFGFPDGVLKRMISFNGRFPGPVITCTRGKWLIVRVTNSITGNEPSSIHWHGLEQRLTPFFDGPEYITQCPIIEGTSMIYKFRLQQAGTYWYHTHHSYQYVEGAWGFIIAKNNPNEVWENSYQEEALIAINDWNHLPAKQLTETYLTQGIFPACDSSLINGRGTFECESINVTAGQVCDPNLQQPSIVNVIRGKVYRLRVLNAAGARPYNFSIDSHKLVVIETDGVDTMQSPAVDIVPILPAQRYSLLVSMNQPENEYWIRISGEPLSTSGLIGKAILRYIADPATSSSNNETEDVAGGPAPETAQSQPISTDTSNTTSINNVGINVEQILADAAKIPMPNATQGRPHHVMQEWDNIIAAGGLAPPTMPALQQYFPTALPTTRSHQVQSDKEHSSKGKLITLPTTLPPNPATATLLDEQDCPPYGINISATLSYDVLVTIVIEDCPLPGAPSRLCMNGNPFTPGATSSLPVLFQAIKNQTISPMANPSLLPDLGKTVRLVVNNHHALPHPWHLHGHTFWVLGHAAAEAGDFNATRDEAALTTNGVRRDTTFNNGHSWTVFEFTTNNPGTWIFHCHINWHLQAGLGWTFIEGESLIRQVYQEVPLQSIVTCRRVGVLLY